MKIKTSQLSGPALDWAVAEAVDAEPYLDKGRLLCLRGGTLNNLCNYHTNWLLTGPLMEKYRIMLDNDCPSYVWAKVKGAKLWSGGVHPLEAICRAIVASELGDEVDVPDELGGVK